jgi:protein gp37
MGKDSNIAWTHHTFSPWWGCQRVSPGCEHCYAESFATGRMKLPIWGAKAERRFFGEKHWNEPVRWNKAAAKAGERHRVFCSSMADVFEDRVDLVLPRGRLFDLIEATPNLDWLLLTKRPENMLAMLPRAWLTSRRPNVWLGTTCEDQRRAEERLPRLLATPAVVHFVSAEPLLEPIDFLRWIGGIDWLIVGGESGPKARPFDLAWARSIVDQCRSSDQTAERLGRYGCAPFVKQLGTKPVHTPPDWGASCRPDGIRDSHGADWEEWPSDLKVREFPAVVR